MPIDTSSLKEKARVAADRRNYDYAIDTYLEILKLEPGDVEARKALRSVALRRQKETGLSRGSATMKNLFTHLKLAFPSRNHEQVMLDCEKILALDPTNANALKKLASAAIAADFKLAAVAALEDLRASNPDDVAGLRLLEQAYRQVGDIAKALETNSMILRAKPDDRDAAQAIRDLSAQKMSGVFEKAALSGADGKAARAVVKSDDEAQRLNRELRTDDDVRGEIADTLKDIEKNPEDSRLFVKLGNLHLRLKEYDEADQQFGKAKELSPTEYTITMKVQDVQIARLRDAAVPLLQAYKANPKDEKTKATYAAAYNKLREYRLKCFIEREKQFPTDNSIAFELGSIYFEMGSLDEAIRRFQKTVHDPKFRLKSHLNLGISFQKKKQYNLAVKAYSEGNEGLQIYNQDKMTLLYHLADCLEEMGEKEKAKANFTAIYERDIGFKDVAKRLERL